VFEDRQLWRVEISWVTEKGGPCNGALVDRKLRFIDSFRWGSITFPYVLRSPLAAISYVVLLWVVIKANP
jgi:hypothetical protein